MSATPDARETYTRDRRTVSIEFRGGKAVAAGTKESRGEAVRVFVGGKLGAASRTGPASPADSAALVERAVEAALAGDSFPFRFPGPGEPSVSPRTFEAATETLAPADLQALGRSAVARVADAAPDVSVDLELAATVTRSTLESSAGTSLEERATTFFASLDLSLVADGDLVNVSAEAGARGPAFVLDALVERVLARLAQARRRAPRSERYTRVLFAPEAVPALLDPFVTGLDGLEAALGGSPLAYALGREVADPRLTLVDDGLLNEGLASSRWDGEGVPRRTTSLIDRGVLSSFFHDLRSAAEAGTESTGSAVRAGLLPGRAPGNWILRTAEALPLAGLLREAGDALLVVDLLGVGQSSGRDGAFSNPTALAFAVRDGEVVGRVTDLVVSGNAYEALREGLVAGGGDAEWSHSLGHPLLAPSLLLESLSVSG